VKVSGGARGFYPDRLGAVCAFEPDTRRALPVLHHPARPRARLHRLRHDPLARDLGDDGAPFRWDEDRRAQLRAELDAFFFRLYGIDDRDDVDYICQTFQTDKGGLKYNDIAKYGTYSTKDLTLAAYDAMSAADASGIPLRVPLTPPPGHGPRHPIH
jgi:hypothetical protein